MYTDPVSFQKQSHFTFIYKADIYLNAYIYNPSMQSLPCLIKSC
jgi:hypothetical protein